MTDSSDTAVMIDLSPITIGEEERNNGRTHLTAPWWILKKYTHTSLLLIYSSSTLQYNAVLCNVTYSSTISVVCLSPDFIGGSYHEHPVLDLCPLLLNHRDKWTFFELLLGGVVKYKDNNVLLL